MFDPSKPVTNPALAQALDQLHAHNTPENQDRVLNELLWNAHFLAPVVQDQAAGDAVQFQLIASQDGHRFLPAFTDWGELRGFCGPRDQKTVVLTFDDYAAMLAGDKQADGFVVNPLNAPLTLDRAFVAQLAKQKRAQAGYSQTIIQKDTKVLLGDAGDVPQAMLDALCLAVQPVDEVRRLFLRLMSRPGQSQPTYLIVVDHQGEQDRVFRTIADAARPHLEGRLVEMVPLDSDFGRAAVQNAAPFFSRKKD